MRIIRLNPLCGGFQSADEQTDENLYDIFGNEKMKNCQYYLNKEHFAELVAACECLAKNNNPEYRIIIEHSDKIR